MYAMLVLLSNVPETMSTVEDWPGTMEVVKVVVNSERVVEVLGYLGWGNWEGSSETVTG
jgi:hypothetical protein